MIVKTRPSCRRIEHIGGEHPHTTSHHSTGRVHLPRHGLRAGGGGRTAVLAQAIALRSPATDRAHLPALAPITSSAGGRRMTLLFDGEHERPAFLLEDPSQAISGAYLSLLLGQVERATGPRRCLGPRNVLFARRPVRRVDRSEGTEPGSAVATGNGLYAAPALVRGGWRPEAAFGGVGSAERYWRRDGASLRALRAPPIGTRVRRIATLPLARPFCRERACKRWLAP